MHPGVVYVNGVQAAPPATYEQVMVKHGRDEGSGTVTMQPAAAAAMPLAPHLTPPAEPSDLVQVGVGCGTMGRR